MQKNPFIARRLDYILVSDQLLPFCKDSIMSDVGFSDHKVVSLNIDFSSFQRGPSFYKFNVSLLHEHILTNEISREINRIKLLEMEPHLKWEYIKASIKDISMFYGRLLAHEKRKEKSKITLKMKELEIHL